MAFGKTFCLALQVCLKNETLLQTNNNKCKSLTQIQRHGTDKKIDNRRNHSSLNFVNSYFDTLYKFMDVIL